MPTAPPNSGPSAREIMKYEPPPATTPFVATALIDIDVVIVCVTNDVIIHPHSTLHQAALRPLPVRLSGCLIGALIVTRKQQNVEKSQ